MTNTKGTIRVEFREPKGRTIQRNVATMTYEKGYYDRYADVEVPHEFLDELVITVNAVSLRPLESSKHFSFFHGGLDGDEKHGHFRVLVRDTELGGAGVR